MTENQVKLAERNEVDREILYFIREMQRLAPVALESVYHFLRDQRRRNLPEKTILDRLDYLVSAKYLEQQKEWSGGEFVHYRITADGMDFMDRAIPPRGWKNQ